MTGRSHWAAIGLVITLTTGAALMGAIALALAPALVPVAAAQTEAALRAPIIRNPAQPASGVVPMKLRELWRVGGEDDDALFGVIAEVLADEQGNLYLLDAQLAQVQVYSPAGKPLRTLGRAGEGPGEVRQPSDIILTPDGKVAMIQTFPGRVVLVDREGLPAGGFSVGGSDPSQGRFGVLVEGAAGGGNLYLAGMHMTMSGQGLSDQNYFLARCNLEGNELNTFATKTSTINYADFVIDEGGVDFVWGGRWTVDVQGNVYVAPERNRYSIQVAAPDGRVLRVIERDYEPWKRNAEEERQAQLQMQAMARNYPMPPRSITTLATEPDITGMFAAAGGELWVRTSRGDRVRPVGVFTTFDVFDATGKFVRQVALQGAGDPLQDALYLVGNDRVVMVTQALQAYRTMQGVTDEAAGETAGAPMEVICFALER
jgi:hypothetical protein